MKPVMLATDGSPTAEEATEKAIELAKALGAELVVTTVWDIPYSTLGYAAIPPNVEFSKASEDQARKVVAEASQQAHEADVSVKSRVLRGFPVGEICHAAEELDPQLLVVGSHGWGPVKRMLFGSVSTGVLHQASCPVLVVRGSAEDADAEHERSHVEAAV
jgi:nucleotide-binding universal stress UspA family protein